MELTCGLGSQSADTYKLVVALPNEQEIFEELPLVSAEFRRLDWLGFISLSKREAAFFIDDLKITQEKDG